VSRLKTSLPESLAATAQASIADWQSGGKMRRLWDRDASLWTGDDELKWLGWLDIVEEQMAQNDQLPKTAAEVQAGGFEHVLLLGMGGSSRCPEVLRMTFRHIPGFPMPHVLDSTDPAQIKAFERQIDIAETLFIVSSKACRRCASSFATTSAWPRVSDSDRASCIRQDRLTRVARARGGGLQITCDDTVELPVPSQKYTFGVVRAAQARGDFQVLAERGRRALRVHLGKDWKAGLATLQAAIQKAV
jgi:hypothetical protein